MTSPRRRVSTPLCLYDCDVPADGSTAVIVSRVDSASGLRKPPVRIEAMGTALHGRPSWDQFDDLTTMAMRDAAAMMWLRTDLRPADVDLAEVYDGFSFIALCWLEALGFCAHGEGGPYLAATRHACSSGARPASARWRPGPRWRWPPPGAARWPPACSSPAPDAGARSVRYVGAVTDALVNRIA